MDLQKNKLWRCNNYLRWIRSLPCCNCMHDETVAHHLIGLGSGTMGAKAGDFQAMPTCIVCHRKIHESQSAFDQLLYLNRTQQRALNNGIVSITWSG